MSDPYRTPGEVLTDEERFKRAYNAYWAMMACDQRAFDALPEERKQKHRNETARLRRIIDDLGPKLRGR